jgi:hypothetical protein
MSAQIKLPLGRLDSSIGLCTAKRLSCKKSTNIFFPCANNLERWPSYIQMGALKTVWKNKK